MEFYQSTKPSVDDSGLSGTVGFRFGKKFSVQPFPVSQNLLNGLESSGSGGTQGTIYTLSICVDGVPKFLDVYVDGEPY